MGAYREKTTIHANNYGNNIFVKPVGQPIKVDFEDQQEEQNPLSEEYLTDTVTRFSNYLIKSHESNSGENGFELIKNKEKIEKMIFEKLKEEINQI